jgi:hypothetical protein
LISACFQSNIEPMDTEPTVLELEQASTPIPAPPPPLEDEFGDEKLGERQFGVCTMEEGCQVCQ